jgi:predicted dehydrogenase
MLRVGVAGASRGSSYIELFRRFPETDVVAVMDPDEEALAQCAHHYGIPLTFTDYERMLDEAKLDIVYVASPMQFHAAQSMAALERGIHVFCEVTAAVTLEEARQLLACARRSKAKYMMAENYCFIRANVLVREMVRQGVLGRVYYAEGEYLHNVQHLHRDRHGRPTWRVTWQVGRKGLTYGTHSLGPVLSWLDDKVVEITCQGSGVHTVPSYVTDDTTVALCRTGTGALVRVRVDMVSWRPHLMNYYSLQGTEGAYEAPRAPGEEHKVWIRGRSSDPDRWQSLWAYEAEFLPPEYREVPEFAARSGHWGADYFTLRAFLDAVLGDKPSPIDAVRALDFTVPGLVSEESITRGGVPVAVPDLSEEGDRGGSE